MAAIDKKYHKLLNTILNEGYRYEDPNRKGIFRRQISDYKIVHDFKDGFPALTTKELYWKGVVGELLWILRGDTNIKYLIDNDINIWNKDAYNYYLKNLSLFEKEKGHKTFKEFINIIKENSLEELTYNYSISNYTFGDIGRGYGAQLRNWQGLVNPQEKLSWGENYETHSIDQLAELINTLKTNPMTTKKTVTFWNPAEKDQCALTPCHWSFEILVEPLINECEDTEFWYSEKKGCGCSELDSAICTGNYNQKYQFTLKFHMHSSDTFLGLPFNLSSYALLAQIIGKMTNMIPKGIIGDLSNVHIYEPHLDAVKEQLSRDVNKYGRCELENSNKVLTHIETMVNLDECLKQMEIKDFVLKDYKSHPRIPAEMLAYNK